MNITIIGTGNVGGALATAWSRKGHSINEAVKKSYVILIAGFAHCYDVGGNNRFTLMEQFAFFWINLAMMQGQGRDMGFKLLKR